MRTRITQAVRYYYYKFLRRTAATFLTNFSAELRRSTEIHDANIE